MPSSTTEVFTPSTVARLTFVERDALNRRLVKALQTPGKQIVLFGRSGGGKTTLLENKLYQTYERHYRSRCIRGTTFDELLLDAFDQLEPFFTDTRDSSIETGRKVTIEAKAAIGVVGSIRTQLAASRAERSGSTERRFLPPQLTPSLLASLLGEANACWVIEDLHKAERTERLRVAQSMKLFMDVADQHPDVRIIVVGAMGSARDILELDPEMWNRVSEIEVDLMTPDEIQTIINLGEKELNVLFTPDLREQIVHFSNGLPAVCHQLCLNMCLNEGIIETVKGDRHVFSESALKDSLTDWLAEAADSLRSTYDQAVRQKRTRKYDNCRLVLHALSALPRDGATHQEILAKIREKEPLYPPGNLSTYLGELQRSDRADTVIFDVRSGRYAFESPMLHAYVRAQAIEHHPRKAGDRVTRHDARLGFVYALVADHPQLRIEFDKAFIKALTTKLRIEADYDRNSDDEN